MCQAEWTGAACDVMVPLCRDNCNGHGTCERAKGRAASAARCVCHHGFHGDACQEGDEYGHLSSGIVPSLARHLERVHESRDPVG